MDQVEALLEEGPCIVGVLGPSGSGKTTLLDQLAGFGPGARDDGRLRQVAYIPQAPYLFHGSLRDNVAFYRPGAAEDEVRQALDRAGLAALVQQLPCGLDTVIGDGGRQLSGGQAQRVAVARALLDGRQVWLLDEPTAHLDGQTAAELIACLVPLMEGRSVVVATHDDAWLPYLEAVVRL